MSTYLIRVCRHPVSLCHLRSCGTVFVMAGSPTNTPAREGDDRGVPYHAESTLSQCNGVVPAVSRGGRLVTEVRRQRQSSSPQPWGAYWLDPTGQGLAVFVTAVTLRPTPPCPHPMRGDHAGYRLRTPGRLTRSRPSLGRRAPARVTRLRGRSRSSQRPRDHHGDVRRRRGARSCRSPGR